MKQERLSGAGSSAKAKLETPRARPLLAQRSTYHVGRAQLSACMNTVVLILLLRAGKPARQYFAARAAHRPSDDSSQHARPWRACDHRPISATLCPRQSGVTDTVPATNKRCGDGTHDRDNANHPRKLHELADISTRLHLRLLTGSFHTRQNNEILRQLI